MKKFILLPVLGILSVALFSFKSATSSSDGHIVRCDDGTIIVPTSCPVTREDQNRIMDILISHGPNNGYAVYTDETGATRVYNPTPVDVLRSLDKTYSTDLSSAAAFCGWFVCNRTYGPSSFSSACIFGSELTSSMYAELSPILARYE